ncbi:MAG: hypothetical protein J3K34DRAFT_395179, partial [Monoraphidium minutum]
HPGRGAPSSGSSGGRAAGAPAASAAVPPRAHPGRGAPSSGSSGGRAAGAPAASAVVPPRAHPGRGAPSSGSSGGRAAGAPAASAAVPPRAHPGRGAPSSGSSGGRAAGAPAASAAVPPRAHPGRGAPSSGSSGGRAAGAPAASAAVPPRADTDVSDDSGADCSSDDEDDGAFRGSRMPTAANKAAFGAILSFLQEVMGAIYLAALCEHVLFVWGVGYAAALVSVDNDAAGPLPRALGLVHVAAALSAVIRGGQGAAGASQLQVLNLCCAGPPQQGRAVKAFAEAVAAAAATDCGGGGGNMGPRAFAFTHVDALPQVLAGGGVMPPGCYAADAATLRCLDRSPLPVPAGGFDVVLCLNGIYTSNADELAARCLSALGAMRPRGLAIFTLPPCVGGRVRAALVDALRVAGAEIVADEEVPPRRGTLEERLHVVTARRPVNWVAPRAMVARASVLTAAVERRAAQMVASLRNSAAAAASMASGGAVPVGLAGARAVYLFELPAGAVGKLEACLARTKGDRRAKDDAKAALGILSAGADTYVGSTADPRRRFGGHVNNALGRRHHCRKLGAVICGLSAAGMGNEQLKSCFRVVRLIAAVEGVTPHLHDGMQYAAEQEVMLEYGPRLMNTINVAGGFSATLASQLGRNSKERVARLKRALSDPKIATAAAHVDRFAAHNAPANRELVCADPARIITRLKEAGRVLNTADVAELSGAQARVQAREAAGRKGGRTELPAGELRRNGVASVGTHAARSAALQCSQEARHAPAREAREQHLTAVDAAANAPEASRPPLPAMPDVPSHLTFESKGLAAWTKEETLMLWTAIVARNTAAAAGHFDLGTAATSDQVGLLEDIQSLYAVHLGVGASGCTVTSDRLMSKINKLRAKAGIAGKMDLKELDRQRAQHTAIKRAIMSAGGPGDARAHLVMDLLPNGHEIKPHAVRHAISRARVAAAAAEAVAAADDDATAAPDVREVKRRRRRAASHATAAAAAAVAAARGGASAAASCSAAADTGADALPGASRGISAGAPAAPPGSAAPPPDVQKGLADYLETKRLAFPSGFCVIGFECVIGFVRGFALSLTWSYELPAALQGRRRRCDGRAPGGARERTARPRGYRARKGLYRIEGDRIGAKGAEGGLARPGGQKMATCILLPNSVVILIFTRESAGKGEVRACARVDNSSAPRTNPELTIARRGGAGSGMSPPPPPTHPSIRAHGSNPARAFERMGAPFASWPPCWGHA